jgi:hypothetical protein
MNGITRRGMDMAKGIALAGSLASPLFDIPHCSDSHRSQSQKALDPKFKNPHNTFNLPSWSYLKRGPIELPPTNLNLVNPLPPHPSTRHSGFHSLHLRFTCNPHGIPRSFHALFPPSRTYRATVGTVKQKLNWGHARELFSGKDLVRSPESQRAGYTNWKAASRGGAGLSIAFALPCAIVL